MKNVIEFLEKTEKKYTNKIAIIEEEKRCTFKELVTNSKKVASGIIKEDIINKPIPILMEKGINTIYAFFGAIYSGNFYVMLNPDLPTKRIQNIFEELDSDVIITDEAHLELACEIAKEKKIIKIEELLKNSINEQKILEIKKNFLDVNPLYVNFTSGSTGTPKGVVISHKTVIDFIDIFTKKFKINKDDIIGNQAPFDFDVSVKDIYSSIKTGATLVIIPKRMFSNPSMLLDYICNNKITTLIWAVSALCLITIFHGLDYKIPETVNKVLFSGEVMPLKHLKIWMEHLPKAVFVNLYGPTEITCNCTYYIVKKNKKYNKAIPIGVPFENEEIILLDDNNKKITKSNIQGEICVKGNALALGYYNNLELSKEKFIQNPLNKKYMDLIYKTGDLAYYDENGDLNFDGRKDFQIKHQGHRIELEEIQIAMEEIEEIKRACVLYDEEKNKIRGYYIGNIDKKEIHNKLKRTLPIYMIPSILINMENFPLNKNGKIDRNKLKCLK